MKYQEAGLESIPSLRWRLSAAWAVIRGHSVAYRIKIDDGVLSLPIGRGIACGCEFRRTPRCSNQRMDRRCYWTAKMPPEMREGDHWHQFGGPSATEDQ